MTQSAPTGPEGMTKGQLVERIAVMIGVEPPKMSTGSTEPRTLFLDINIQLGLGLDVDAGKPELARQIVEASGSAWYPDYESRGATVTKAGLIAVFHAVSFFLS